MNFPTVVKLREALQVLGLSALPETEVELARAYTCAFVGEVVTHWSSRIFSLSEKNQVLLDVVMQHRCPLVASVFCRKTSWSPIHHILLDARMRVHRIFESPLCKPHFSDYEGHRRKIWEENGGRVVLPEELVECLEEVLLRVSPEEKSQLTSIRAQVRKFNAVDLEKFMELIRSGYAVTEALFLGG